MDNKDKSIIDKILKIAGVNACAVSSLDGEVLRYETKDGGIPPNLINKVSSEISKLFASYSISSIDISSLYLNFEDMNIIINGFGSGFIFIVSQKNSNVNLLKMETSYLESEFVKIVNESLMGITSKPFAEGIDSGEQNFMQKKDEDVFNSLLGEKSGGTIKAHEIISKIKLDSVKGIFSSSLGPISSMLFDEKIKELNEDVNNFNVKNIKDLINSLSEEIEDGKDRLNFVKSARNIVNY